MAIDLEKLQPNFVTPDLNNKIWLFYGEMATRKTSVACKFPQHLLLAFDIGYKFINNAYALPLQSWAEFKQAIKQLDKQSIKDKFKVVIIDTIGKAYQACYQYKLQQMGVEDPGEVGYGMGWKKIRNEFETTIGSIAQKGYGVIMIAHADEVEKEDKVSKKKVTTTKIDIDKRPDLIIRGLADFVLYLHKEVKDGTADEPTVYAYSDLIDIDTKSRSRYFSPRFEFTYENLKDELEKAVKTQNELEQVQIEGREVINPYAVEKVDFNELLSSVKELANLLLEKGYENDVSQTLLAMFKGVPLSELRETDDNISKLQVAYATFDELKTKARI